MTYKSSPPSPTRTTSATPERMPVSMLRDQALVQFLYWLPASQRGSLNDVTLEEVFSP